MSWTLTINSVAKSFVLGSISFSRPVSGIATMSVDIDSLNGSYLPVVGQDVVLTESSTRRFAGVINGFRRVGIVGGDKPSMIRVRINVIALAIHAQHRYVVGNLAAGNLKAALTFVVTYLSGYGITLDGAQVNGPTLDARWSDQLCVGDRRQRRASDVCSRLC